MAIIGFTDQLWVMVIALFICGFLFSGAQVLWGTLLQRRVPPAMLGRVSSLDFFVSLALMPVSMAIAGPVGETIGIAPAFLIAGLVPTCCGRHPGHSPARRGRVAPPTGCPCAFPIRSPLTRSPTRPPGADRLVYERSPARDSGSATSSSDLFSASMPRNDLDQPADDHHAGGQQVAVEQQRRVAAVADQRAVQHRAERAEALGDGEEHRDGHARTSSGKISLTVR